MRGFLQYRLLWPSFGRVWLEWVSHERFSPFAAHAWPVAGSPTYTDSPRCPTACGGQGGTLSRARGSHHRWAVAAGLRPTPSRVRETLFNWLGHDLSGWRVLDAFAGSGALGFEAASRGAQEVWLLERDPALAKSLKATQAKLSATQVQVAQADALSWMRQAVRQAAFDLVFIDPPFEDDLFWPALQAALECVPESGWIYLEASAAWDALPGHEAHEALRRQLRVHRQGQAGAVHFHLFQRMAG